MLKSGLCEYSNAYILVSRTIAVLGARAADAPEVVYLQLLLQYKQAIFKNCAPFTDYITEINNTQVGSAKDFVDFVDCCADV